MITDIGSINDSNGRTLLRMWSVTVPKGERPLRQHSHISFELTYAVSGSGTYTCGEKKYQINSGDLFIFSSNEQHCITTVDSNELQMLNIHFEPRYLWGRSKDSLTSKSSNFCFSHSKDFENRIAADTAASLTGLLLMIETELTEKKQEYALQVKNLVNMIIISLIRSHGYSADTPTLTDDRLNSVRATIRYIDNHLSDSITLSSLAKAAGMSPNYFSAVFHSVSGITLWDYVNSRRIETAMQLLKESKKSNILEIAACCGFNNTANFNKTFKKITGMTPSEYRSSKSIDI